MRLKLHISPCPNDTFMFDALINNRIEHSGIEFDVTYLDIEELNNSLKQEQADISKCSYAILNEILERYNLLMSGSALGRGNGPLLVRREGDNTPIKNVAVPGLHTTACALMQRLFPKVKNLIPMLFSDIAEAIECGRVDAGVLIHEGRFVYQKRRLELVADLGLMWEEQTLLPLPLGAIVAKKELDNSVVQRVDTLLRQSIEYAMKNPSHSREFIKRHAQELDDDVIDKHIALFVNQYSLELGSVGKCAVERLLNRRLF